MKFKLLLAVLLTALMLSLCAASAETIAAGSCGDDLAWTLDSEGTLSISGTGRMDDSDYAEDYPWHDYRDSICALVIDEGLTGLGMRSFSGCANLTSVSLPESLSNIGIRAFENCPALAQINFPADLGIIAENAFEGCTSLTEITIPATIRYLEMESFAGCTALNKVTFLGSAWLDFGADVFSGCSPEFWVYEGSYIESRLVKEGYTCFHLDKAFSGSCGDSLSWSFSSDGRLNVYGSGGMYDYYSCSAPWHPHISDIKTVYIGYGVTSIGENAFSMCDALVSADISGTVTEIGSDAFAGCAALTEVYMSDGLTSIGNGAFSECHALTSVSIPRGVTRISDYAFAFCSELREVSLPDSLTAIGESAFTGTPLQEVTIPDGVTEIGIAAFNYCEELSSISLPDGLASIGDYAFSDCIALTSVRIPASVEFIDACAFGWTGLEQVTFMGRVMPEMAEDAFEECALTVVCHEGSEVDQWAAGQGYTVEYLPAFSGSCGESLTWNLSGDGTLTISGTGRMADFELTQPSESTFASTAPWYASREFITSIVVEDGVSSIGMHAFYDLDNLVSAEIADSVASIGNFAFMGCAGLYEVDFPDGLTSMGIAAFSNCPSLYCVSLPEGLTSLPVSAFSYCTDLNEVSLPDGLTTIGAAAFQGCDSLFYISLPDSLTTIGDNAFSQCTSMMEISLPDNLTSIGAGIFWGCTGLEYVSLSESLTAISDQAFMDCANIYSIQIPSSVSSIGSQAFSGCSSLGTIRFPGKSMPETAADAFSGCDSQITVVCHQGSEVDAWATGQGYTLEYLPATFGMCGENVAWNLSDDGVLTVSGTGAMTSAPWTDADFHFSRAVIEPGVTSICENAFQGTGVHDFSLPEGLLEIGSGAISGCSITEIDLPSSLTVIGNDAFYCCESLESIEIPGSVTSIGTTAFSECYSLESVVLNEGLLEIGKWVFMASPVTEINLPSTLTTIGKEAFWGCDFTEITIPASVTTVGYDAFGACSALTKVVFPGKTMPDSINLPAGVVIHCLPGSEAAAWAAENGYEVVLMEITGDVLVLPANTTVIEAEAFMGTDALKVVIPASVDSIGARAFADCTQLMVVEFEGDVFSIAEDAFDGCENLTFICESGSKAAVFAAANGFAVVNG